MAIGLAIAVSFPSTRLITLMAGLALAACAGAKRPSNIVLTGGFDCRRVIRIDSPRVRIAQVRDPGLFNVGALTVNAFIPARPRDAVTARVRLGADTSAQSVAFAATRDDFRAPTFEGMRPGEYWLTVEALGYQPTIARVRVRRAGTDTVDIPLEEEPVC
jgi:hypothetical protein